MATAPDLASIAASCALESCVSSEFPSAAATARRRSEIASGTLAFAAVQAAASLSAPTAASTSSGAAGSSGATWRRSESACSR